jgi:fermentation-respiration switch protein FrsA (DUF1100 family)
MATVSPPQAARKPLWRRVAVKAFRTILLAYVVVVVYMKANERGFIYYPTPAAEEWTDPPDPSVEDVWLTDANGTRLHGWWSECRDAEAVFLFCHGNSGNVSQLGFEMLKWRQLAKASMLAFDYPGYGKSEGKPSEAGCNAATSAAYEWLTTVKRIPPTRVVIYGESLGGGPAVELARGREHRALVLYKTFTSLPDVALDRYPFLPARLLMSDQFDNLAKIGQCHRPVFVAHGTADTLVPYALGERLFAAANEPKVFLPMPGVGHNDIASADYVPALKAFLRDVAP